MLYWTAALVLGLGVATVSADGDGEQDRIMVDYH